MSVIQIYLDILFIINVLDFVKFFLGVRYSDDLFYALESMNKVAVDDTISMLLSNAPGLKERLGLYIKIK